MEEVVACQRALSFYHKHSRLQNRAVQRSFAVLSARDREVLRVDALLRRREEAIDRNAALLAELSGQPPRQPSPPHPPHPPRDRHDRGVGSRKRKRGDEDNREDNEEEEEEEEEEEGNNEDNNEDNNSNDSDEGVQADPSAFEMDQVRSLLRMLARDWSSEGGPERAQAYLPITTALATRFPSPPARSGVRVLVPGCGAGRLAWEIASLGFATEASDSSIAALLGLSAMVRRAHEGRTTTIHPYLHEATSVWTREAQLRAVSVPDVSAPRPDSLVVKGGEFLSAYREPEQWDVVVTCFFLDCANNVLDFARRIHTLLKPGALWLNLGPLLYHFADVPGEASLNLSGDELLCMLPVCGFEVEKHDTVETEFCVDRRSLLLTRYRSLFWACRKPRRAEGSMPNGGDEHT